MSNRSVELVFADGVSIPSTVPGKTESLLDRETIAIQELAAVSVIDEKFVAADVIFGLGPALDNLLSDNRTLEFDPNRQCYVPNLAGPMLSMLLRDGILPNVATMRKALYSSSSSKPTKQ